MYRAVRLLWPREHNKIKSAVYASATNSWNLHPHWATGEYPQNRCVLRLFLFAKRYVLNYTNLRRLCCRNMAICSKNMYLGWSCGTDHRCENTTRTFFFLVWLFVEKLVTCGWGKYEHDGWWYFQIKSCRADASRESITKGNTDRRHRNFLSNRLVTFLFATVLSSSSSFKKIVFV